MLWEHVACRLRAAPIFSQSVEHEAKKNLARSFFFFASRSTDCEKIGAARSLCLLLSRNLS